MDFREGKFDALSSKILDWWLIRLKKKKKKDVSLRPFLRKNGKSLPTCIFALCAHAFKGF